jgi:ribosomal protein L37AE/L43A
MNNDPRCIRVHTRDGGERILNTAHIVAVSQSYRSSDDGIVGGVEIITCTGGIYSLVGKDAEIVWAWYASILRSADLRAQADDRMASKQYCAPCKKQTLHRNIALIISKEGSFDRWECDLCGARIEVAR